MPGRNEREAWRAFREPIERAVGCVDLTMRLSERRTSDGRRMLFTPADRDIQLAERLTLTFAMTLSPFLDDGQWHMTTRRYSYAIRDRDELMFRWEWHPESKSSGISYPHLHVPSAKFSTRHLPTGRIALEDILVFAIDQLKARPTDGGARQRLNEIVDVHKRHRRWS